MAEDKDLATAVKALPKHNSLLEELSLAFKRWADKEKFAEIKVGEKTFSYSGEKFDVGVDLKGCPDGEHETEFGIATVKGEKVIDLKKKEQAIPATVDFSAQIKTVMDSYEAKLAAQKTDFDAQVKTFKDEINQKIDTMVAGKLKEIFDIVQKIAELPSAQSAFKKVDGEPAQPNTGDKWSKLMAEAKKTITDKTFNN